MICQRGRRTGVSFHHPSSEAHFEPTTRLCDDLRGRIVAGGHEQKVCEWLELDR